MLARGQAYLLFPMRTMQALSMHLISARAVLRGPRAGREQDNLDFLRRCPLVVRAFCAQQGLPYCEKGLAGSYGDILRYPHAAGRGALPATAD